MNAVNVDPELRTLIDECKLQVVSSVELGDSAQPLYDEAVEALCAYLVTGKCHSETFDVYTSKAFTLMWVKHVTFAVATFGFGLYISQLEDRDLLRRIGILSDLSH